MSERERRYDPARDVIGALSSQFPIDYSDEEIVEAMKDFCHILGAVGLEVTFEREPGKWTHILVHHATGLSDSPDGWDVEIKGTSL